MVKPGFSYFHMKKAYYHCYKNTPVAQARLFLLLPSLHQGKRLPVLDHLPQVRAVLGFHLPHCNELVPDAQLLLCSLVHGLLSVIAENVFLGELD